MRKRYIQHPETLALVPANEYETSSGTFFLPDIQPYRSMADGSWITSRSHHREHLKRHNAIEIGNEVSAMMKPRNTDVDPVGRKELIREQIMGMTHEQRKAAVKKDVDFIRWNSRNLPKG